MKKSISAERLHFAAVSASTLRTKSNFALGIQNCRRGNKSSMATSEIIISYSLAHFWPDWSSNCIGWKSSTGMKEVGWCQVTSRICVSWIALVVFSLSCLASLSLLAIQECGCLVLSLEKLSSKWEPESWLDLSTYWKTVIELQSANLNIKKWK